VTVAFGVKGAAYTAASSDAFRDVIGRFLTGVTVVTTTADGQFSGTTASAVSSVSLDPPTVLVCLKDDSITGDAIRRAGTFVINILGEAHGDVALDFAVKGADATAKAHLQGSAPGGLPMLPDGIAHLVCRVNQTVVAGTHLIFIAEVEHVASREGAPLAYFRGRFGRLGDAS
jgi:flavin reductase (DIM6/NTAB) family NADH-FMN oxidoreductase RutF